VNVPLFAQREAIQELIPEIAARQRDVLESGRYVLGPEVEAFEAEFATYVRASHCTGVASGTDALRIALRALGVGPGDEVVVPAFTFYATAEAIAAIGATPVFCDVDPETWCMTAATAEPVLSERTRALLPVHLFGNPAPIGELRQLAEHRGISVVEDAAQAHGTELGGAMAGSLGHAAAFSFFPAKNLGGFGDGGAVTTDDPEAAARARRLRQHGSEDKRVFTEVGYNSRLDELQAAALRVALEHLPAWTAARQRVFGEYLSAGLDQLVAFQSETAGGASSRHLVGIATPERDRLAAALAEAGVESRAYYETPLYLQPALESWAPAAPLPATERLCSEMLALPMGPDLDAAAVTRVVDAVRQSLAGSRAA